MPLFELFRLTKSKLESSQDKKSLPMDDEGAELVWVNGQISMLNQSNKSRNSKVFVDPVPRIIQSGSSKEIGKSALSSKSLDRSLIQDDDLIPWMNQALKDSLQSGYCSELFPNVCEVSVNEQGIDVAIDQTAFSSFQARKNHDQSSSSQSNRFQTQPFRKQSDRTKNLAGNQTLCEETVRKQDPMLPCTKPSLINFSHFVLPAAIGKTNLYGSASHDETRIMRSNDWMTEDKVSHSSDKVLQTKVVSAKESEDKSAVPSKDNENKTVISGNSCKKDQEIEKAVEPAVQSSSVCSGDSLELPLDNRSRSLKRQYSEIQDTDCHSEDNEEEIMDATKAAASAGGLMSKRIRSAEVHNLSERKRRDKINEKMRALQELVPNCNKVDKASMLDEAIEHIKSLKHQIQIMAIGAGYYMQPMMYQPAMQPMHIAAHMPHYPAAAPMAMGMSYGMGMPDMSGVTLGQVLPHFAPSGLQPLSHPGNPMAQDPGASGGLFRSSDSQKEKN